jgi:hypothetical protein
MAASALSKLFFDPMMRTLRSATLAQKQMPVSRVGDDASRRDLRICAIADAPAPHRMFRGLAIPAEDAARLRRSGSKIWIKPALSFNRKRVF